MQYKSVLLYTVYVNISLYVVILLVKSFFFLLTEHRLVCKIHEQRTSSNQELNITVEVHEGKVEGRYSIEGQAHMSGFSFVVRISFESLYA